MTGSETARAEIEAYLEAVEGAMSGRPEGVRREILEELREQIDAAMELTDGSAEAAGRILAEMDAPESFREPEGAAGGTAAGQTLGGEGRDGRDGESFADGGPDRGGRRSGREQNPCGPGRGRGLWSTVLWMALAMGAGYWLGAGGGCGGGGGAGGGDEGDGTEVAAVEHHPVMTVRKLETTGLTEDLEANLILKLSADPQLPSLKEKLVLTDGDGKRVGWRLAGRLGKGMLALTTEPLGTRELKARLESGLASAEEGVEDSLGETGWKLTFDGILELGGWSSKTGKFGSERSIELRFGEPLAGRDVLDHITVEPETEWHGAVVRNQVLMFGDFTPGETYKVTVGEGPWGRSGARLAKKAEAHVRMNDCAPAARFAKDARTYFFAPGESGKLRVETCALDEVEVSVRKMLTNNVPRFDADGRWQDWQNFGKWKEWKQEVQIDDERLHLGHVDLDFSEFAKVRGIYELRVEWNRWHDLNTAVVVSDLGITAQDWPDAQKTVAWVNRLGTGGAVADAQVELWTQKGQLAAAGRTDADGCLWLDWSDLDTEDLGSATMLTAQADGDWTCMDLTMISPDPAGPGEGRPWLEKGKFEALVWTERNLYRPGEKMLVQALARDRDLRGPGKAFPAVLGVRKAGEKEESASKPVEVGKDGAVTAEMSLGTEAATGEYKLELRLPGKDGELLGSGTFYVEDFVPPQIRVKLEPEKGMKKGGERVKVKVSAENLFGGAAAGLDVDVKSRVVPRKFRPAGWEDWTFGKADDKDIAGDSCSARLDDAGEAEVELALPRRVLNGGAVSLEVSATVHEVGGRTVTKTADVDYDLHGRYVGLRPCWKGTVQEGPQKVELALVGADGKGIEGEGAVEVILKKVAWHNVMRDWSWTSERQEVEVQRVAVVAGGMARSWEFDVAEGGEYVLQVRDPQGGAVTRLEFEAGWDWWWAEKPMERPEAVEVKWVPDDAQPGQRVKLSLAAPFAGDAMVAVSGEGPLGCRRMAMGGDHAEMEWVVGEDWPETVYATVEVVRGAADHGDARGARAMGNGRLKVRRPAHELKVEVAAPEKVRPQDVLKVEVRALRSDGSAAKGKATVTATDVALLEMSDTEPPRVVEAFLDPRRWTGRLRDPYGRLLQAVAAGRSADGGDGARRIFKRMNPVNSRRFKPLSLWKTDVELDAEGRATVEIPLPEFSGELRVTAVARNRDAAGVSTQAVKVARAVTVEPALPRFAAPGDRFTACIPVWNGTDAALEAEAEYGAAGPLQVSPARERIALAAGGRGNGSVEVSAGPKAGPSEFRIRVQGGGETYEEAIELPVRPAGPLQLEETFRKVAPGEEMVSEVPEGWLEGSQDAQVEVSTGASIRMGGALQALLRYPYGCLEQTVSKAYPLVGCEEWVRKLAPGAWGVVSPRGHVEAAIQRVATLLHSSWGFRMWPDGSWYDDSASLYALEFLLAAKEAGYRVPESVLETALGWAQRLRGTPDGQAWAVDLLSQAGHPGWQSLLARRCELLDVEVPGDEGCIHLARAQQRAGHPKEALELLESVAKPRERRRTGDDWVASPVRTASLLLRAWLEIDAESPVVDELAQILASWQTGGSWGAWATQDNAMGLVAFGKIAQRLPEDPGLASGTVRSEGPDGAEEKAFDGVPRWSGVAAEGARKVVVRNTGTSPIYVRVTWGGVSETPPPPESRGAKIRRELFGLDGAPLADWTLKRGQLAVVKLTVEAVGGVRNHVVVEDLLPAGWEIENPNLKTSEKVPWVEKAPDASSCRHREARDDRMLYFLQGLGGTETFYYVVRAVTPGDFVHPGASVSGMYDPEVRGREPAGRVSVVP